MRKVTLESFCRDGEGELRGGTEAAWSHSPFRVGGFTAATNGHVMIWRATRTEDAEWPELEESGESAFPPRGQRVLAYIGRHPGASACRSKWPTAAPVHNAGKPSFHWNPARVYLPQKLRVSVNATYRDMVARFGKSIGAPVLYATPRSAMKPVAFTVGEWSGFLMPLREYA